MKETNKKISVVSPTGVGRETGVKTTTPPRHVKLEPTDDVSGPPVTFYNCKSETVEGVR